MVFMLIRVTTRTCKLIESMQDAGDMYRPKAQRHFEGLGGWARVRIIVVTES
jgi:hypothetical protein